MKNIDLSTDSVDLAFQVEILKQIPTPVMAVDRDMHIVYANDATCNILHSDLDSLKGKTCSTCFDSEHCGTSNCCMIQAMKENKQFSSRNRLNIQGDMTPIEYFAVPLFDDDQTLIGGLEFIVDITDRVTYEKKLKEQASTIHMMSTPTLQLWDDVLMLPVVGIVDSLRAQQMMESMLLKISETFSKVIILDIQGVAAVDTAVANHLIKITKATKLMGCECILSGISPAVAQTIVHLGIDMKAITTKATLSDALEEAFSILNVTISK